jgi:hypothetical protein
MTRERASILTLHAHCLSCDLLTYTSLVTYTVRVTEQIDCLRLNCYETTAHYLSLMSQWMTDSKRIVSSPVYIPQHIGLCFFTKNYCATYNTPVLNDRALGLDIQSSDRKPYNFVVYFSIWKQILKKNTQT